jgi:membrane associated rhomboid family serine protease
MRRLYLIIMAVSGVSALAAFRQGMYMSPYSSGASQITLIFIASIVIFAVFGAMALLQANSQRLGDWMPFRLMRLWAAAKEQELRKRAGKSEE